MTNASISPKLAFGAEAKNRSVAYKASASLDSDSFDIAIKEAYRNVFGNCYVMANERADELEARLKSGQLCMQEFVRGLVKTEFYTSRFFTPVSPQRGVELLFKHVLGRPPESQQEVAACLALQADSGFEALVDHLIDSAEYNEAFGADTVPHARAWTIADGISMQQFVRIAALEQSFVISDRASGTDSLLLNNLANATALPIQKPFSSDYVATGAGWAAGRPPADAEKLWRGLALVGGAHLAGMLVNVVAQIMGIHALDRIPAMFLGL